MTYSADDDQRRHEPERRRRWNPALKRRRWTQRTPIGSMIDSRRPRRSPGGAKGTTK